MDTNYKIKVRTAGEIAGIVYRMNNGIHTRIDALEMIESALYKNQYFCSVEPERRI